ncbi:MAG: hypothetical protein HKN91_09785 [Acidimicrobiia bacterium]|nr:hypothetical protein [Acidimicrobiia bacterium]
MNTEQTNQLTRRELLKRGAIVGGVTLWATPVVQVVGMGRAYAKDVSEGCTRYCLKWEIDGNSPTGALTCPPAENVWSNNWQELGRRTASGKGTILECPGDGINDGASADAIADRPGYEFVVYGDVASGFWVAFPSDVAVADLEDQAEPWSGAAKCGQGNVKLTKSQLGMEADPCIDGYNRVFIPVCRNGRDISHLELIVDWCPGDGTL